MYMAYAPSSVKASVTRSSTSLSRALAAAAPPPSPLLLPPESRSRPTPTEEEDEATYSSRGSCHSTITSSADTHPSSAPACQSVSATA